MATLADTNVSIQPFRYFRPTRYPEEKSHVEELISEGIIKKLSQNCYVTDKPVQVEKPGRKGGGLWRTLVYHRTEHGWESYGVPTDKNGLLPLDIMIFRLMDEADGDRQGHTRNIWIDIGIDALERSEPMEKAKAYLWYLHPNEGDIKFVDDANSKIAEVVSKEDAKGGKRHMMLLGGTEPQRSQLVDHIRASFTLAERKVLANCIVEIAKCRGYAGCFFLHDQRGDIPRMGHIVIDPDYLMGYSDVVVHEGIHALRRLDPNREGVLKAPSLYHGADADFEESTTEAEAVIRQKPFTKDKKLTGYYLYIRRGKERDRAEAVREDRITGTDAKGLPEPLAHPKRGKIAQKKVIKNYPQMNISTMKLKGTAEAIDTFFKLQRQKDSALAQVYDPGHPSEADAREAAKTFAPRVIEYRDGRPVVIQDEAEALPPHKGRRSGSKPPEHRGMPSHIHLKREPRSGLVDHKGRVHPQKRGSLID